MEYDIKQLKKQISVQEKYEEKTFDSMNEAANNLNNTVSEINKSSGKEHKKSKSSLTKKKNLFNILSS